MVTEGIVVARTVVDTDYMGPHSKTTMPYETIAQDETKAQAKTKVHPKTEVHAETVLVPVQSLFAPQSSLDMHLPFSLSEVGRPYNLFHHGLQIYKIYNTN